MQRYVEDYPSVDIGLLKRRGLFDAHRTSDEVIIDDLALCFYREPGGSLTVVETGCADPRKQRIKIETRALRYGQRRFFVCPRTGERATKLYLVDGQLASRQGHRLVHLVTTNRPRDVARGRTVHLSNRLSGSALGKGPARGPRKATLMDALESVGDSNWVAADAARIVQRARASNQSHMPPELSPEATEGSSTKFALEAGCAGEKGWSEREVLDALAEPLRNARGLVLDMTTPPQHPPDWLGARARLDVRSLHHAGLLQIGHLRGAALRWDRDSTGVINYVLLAADLQDEFNPFLLVMSRDTFEGVDYRQIIPVEQRAERWYFRCPLSGARKTTLYLREGLFGSDEALNLRKRQWDPQEDPTLDPDDDDLRADEPDEDYPI